MGVDVGDNDITYFQNASFASCKTDCNNRPDCKGFVFSSESYPDKLGTCYIKNNVSNASPNGAWNLFEKNVETEAVAAAAQAAAAQIVAKVQEAQVQSAQVQSAQVQSAQESAAQVQSVQVQSAQEAAQVQAVQ